MKLTATEIKFLKNAIEELKRAEMQILNQLSIGASLIDSTELHYQYIDKEVFDKVFCMGFGLIDGANTYLCDVRCRRSSLERFLKSSSPDES